MPQIIVRLLAVPVDSAKGYHYITELRILKSDHPRYKEGTRFDYGYVSLALEDGYTVVLKPHLNKDLSL